MYAQDEWKLAPSLTFNPGLRVEWLRGLARNAKVEPRAALVWQTTSGFTAHVGYSRFASAPPLESGAQPASLPDERDDYVDAGMQRRLGAITLGIDAYARFVKNYLAEHETVGSAIPTPFGFARARLRGVELFGTYARRGTEAWANVSFSRATARHIIGGEELFDPVGLAAAGTHDVPLGSDRPVTATAGIVQRVGKLSLSADVLISSGAVRTVDVAIPNGDREAPYALLGLAAVYHARMWRRPVDLRVDITNLTDARYSSSVATNLEGGWTRLGRARAISIGFEQGF